MFMRLACPYYLSRAETKMPTRISEIDRMNGQRSSTVGKQEASSFSSRTSSSSSFSFSLDESSYHIFYGLRESPFGREDDGAIRSTPPLIAENSHDVAFLETCQRFEMIVVEPTEEVVQNLRNKAGFQHLVGWRNVLDRLTLIGCGLESELVGEASIEEQLQNTHDKLDNDNRVKSLLAMALQRVAFYRQQNRILNLELQPEDIALKLLAGKRKIKGDHPDPSTLIIIGSGMMSQILARKATTLYGYHEIIIVTRHPKSVADKFDPLGEKVHVVKIANANTKSKQPMQCIIASSKISGEYRDSVRRLIHASSGVCDMSRTSLLNDLPQHTFHFSLDSTIFREHLREQNKTLREVATELRETIVDEQSADVTKQNVGIECR